MTITHYYDWNQGSDEWLAARCGMLTASELKHIITPTLKVSANEKTRAHVYEIAAQRISGHVEAHFISDDMSRGMEEETFARDYYRANFGDTTECGFVINDELGFPVGCSPDGLVGDDGGIEIKSRRQRFQVETIASGQIPAENMLQVQASLFVTRRAWWDFVSYSNGMPVIAIRALPDPDVFKAIAEAATQFEEQVSSVIARYREGITKHRTAPTERREIIYI